VSEGKFYNGVVGYPGSYYAVNYNVAIGYQNEWEGYRTDTEYRAAPPNHHTCPWCDSALSLDALKCSQCGGPQG